MCMHNVHLKKCKKTSQIFTSWCDRRIAKHIGIVQLICRPGIPRTNLEDYPKISKMDAHVSTACFLYGDGVRCLPHLTIP